jgi:hypothetical protein
MGSNPVFSINCLQLRKEGKNGQFDDPQRWETCLPVLFSLYLRLETTFHWI